MFNTLQYTIFCVLCILLAVLATLGLLSYLQKLSKGTTGFEANKDWFRFALPTLLAVLLAFFNQHGFGLDGALHWIYVLLIAIGIPFAVAFFLNRKALERQNARLLVVLTLLFFVFASIFTARWSWHYRQNHVDEDENPHLTKRNWFLIPLWIVTGILGSISGYLWKRQPASVDNNGFLGMV